MVHVTINGAIGSGVNIIGVEVAAILKANYIDRIVLAEAAKLVGSTVEILDIKAHQPISIKDRLTYFLQTMLEHSAMSGASGEPYFSPGIEYLPSEEYGSLISEPITAAQRMDDLRFIKALTYVMNDIASNAGDSVIVGRGSNMILRDNPSVLHVCIQAPDEMRLEMVTKELRIDSQSASKYMGEMERVRVEFFRKFFSVDPDNPSLYHLTFNMGKLSMSRAAQFIAEATSIIT